VSTSICSFTSQLSQFKLREHAETFDKQTYSNSSSGNATIRIRINSTNLIENCEGKFITPLHS